MATAISISNLQVPRIEDLDRPYTEFTKFMFWVYESADPSNIYFGDPDVPFGDLVYPGLPDEYDDLVQAVLDAVIGTTPNAPEAPIPCNDFATLVDWCHNNIPGGLPTQIAVQLILSQDPGANTWPGVPDSIQVTAGFKIATGVFTNPLSDLIEQYLDDHDDFIIAPLMYKPIE